MTLATGSKLDGYEILGLLGAGGMGEVYRARDPVLRREVAIKVLPSFVSQDAERLRRFEQEAQATAALNHPNILAVHHLGTFQGTTYLVSELLEGSTLGQQLVRGPLPVRKVVDYGAQIARGLAAAHEKGIVHRDLKPENIFVTKDGRVKILDFGLAKLTQVGAATADGPTATLQQPTEPGMVLGTVGYMSPEQVSGKTADHRADIFAFGAILYEMLVGKRAFRKPTSAETMTAILQEDPPGISQLAPGTPPALQRVVHRCLEKRAEQRFQSASDLAFALEASSDSGSTSATAIAQPPRSRWTWLAAAAAVVVLAAVVFAWWRIPPAAPVVESVTQLTDDGLAKEGKLATDGSRIYFNEGQTGTWKVAQVSVTGGRTAPVDTKLVNSHVAALAPDGSTLLALVGDGFENPLWSIALPAGEPRRIGSANVQDADFSPDGRIIFARERDLYVADKDGSNPHKLISMAHEVLYPSVSPDGKRIVFRAEVGDGNSLFEIAMDGTSLRKVLSYSHDVQPWCGGWSSDGRYFIYRASQGDARDIWALPMRTGLLHRLGEPFRLTAGPLLYTGVLPSRDGKQIFAIGTKRRGELVHYDLKSQQFLPFLSGISAMDPTFSRDGKWVAYASYPDRSLWRSRSDGTERAQLTYPPMKAFYPFISPDGTRVVFTTLPGEIYVVSMDGGAPQRVVEKGSGFANWSPDGNLLVMMSVDENKPAADKSAYTLDILDLRTGKTSRVPSSSQGLVGALWINQNTLIAARDHGTKFVTIDLKTQKWTELAVGNFVSWHVSPDGRYLCFTVGGAEPKAQRLRFSDRQIETITSLKDLRQAVDSIEETQISIAPDGSAIFTRDIGSQEIYALNVRWP